MVLIQRLFLVVALVLASMGALEVVADTTAPYSKPFHSQGRGWYPSIYWSTGRNLGSYYFPNTDGKPFQELTDRDWDKETHGVVYFYRPNSQWASEELEAPTYYINDEIVFNLRGGSYAYVILPAGTYDFAARKSLMPLFGFEAFDDKTIIAFDLNLLADIGLEIDPGSITYIRHSEVSLPFKIHSELPADDEMRSADVQLVEREVAMAEGEMPSTRYLEPSFWNATDAEQIEELLDGTMQDYGWYSIIFPWSNNFLFGFPIFYVPSDLYRELRPDQELTVEQYLYQYKDDVNEYLEELDEMRQPKRNWMAPWRKPKSQLTLNEELILDRLEREARDGTIRPVEMWDAGETDEDEVRWYHFSQYFELQDEVVPEAMPTSTKYISESRRAELERIKQSLN